MTIFFLTTLQVIVNFFLGTYTIFFFSFFKLLTSKYCVSCTLGLLVNIHSEMNPTQKLKSYHITFLFLFFLLLFLNLVGLIQNFLDVLLVNFYLVQGQYQMSKTLESIHGGKRDGYQDIEDPSQTIAQ